MDIKYFAYVIEIAECGSINKAAKNLKLSQPNLSICIKNLENELGFPIFRRNNTGIFLTNEGGLFLNSARKIMTELDTINNIPSLFSNKENISLSCTYSFDFMNHFIRFKKKNPPAAYEDSFKETGLIQTIRDVVEQRYRMSLFYCFDTVSETYMNLAKMNNLRMIPIAKGRPLILFVSKKNPLSQKKEILFENIKDYKFIMYENFKFEEWLQILGFENDNKILYVFDRGGLIDAIRQSMYVTLMMERVTDTYSEDCVEIPVVNAPCSMNAYIMYYSNYTLNAREKLFIRQLKELFSKNQMARNGREGMNRE